MKLSTFALRISVFLFVLFASSGLYSQGLELNARAYLDGALRYSVEVGETHNRPLMRDNLRDNPFNSQRVIPDQDIYQTPNIVNSYTKVDVTAKYTHVGCGTFAQYKSIPTPFSVFAVTGEDAIVDWMFVELRDKNDYTSVIATRAGLLQRDGDIVDLDGTSPLFFNNVNPDFYFVVIRHRNHLGVMTKYPVSPEDMAGLIDFSSVDTQVFDFGNTNNQFNYSGLAQKNVMVGSEELMVLWGGDFDADGVICYIANNSDVNILQSEVAGFDMNLNPNYKVNFGGSVGYLQSDFDMNGKAKFTAPDDDRNLILEQVLFYSQNTETRTNFVHLVEQLP
ncbi:MAG: hypothetical protein ACJA1A_002979 [Saprospiraceae bacterium]|jgi:hypothetical protein